MAAIRTYQGIAPKIGKNVYVDEASTVIGDVSIGEDSSIWPGAVLRGDVNHIRVGKRTSVQDGAVLHVTHKNETLPDGWPLIIGDDVTIGHNVSLHGCRIGHRILVGIGAIVLDNVTVEDEVIIGAGTLVPPGKTLESGFLYVGSPCKQVRALTKNERERLSYSAAHYVKVKNHFLAETKPTNE
ncbi:MAG: gamma carbonic anhydrase family protein [Cellvibrionaceae bacterium]